ncbi:MAG: endonuclease [Prevotella sp.]|nr:endonuclease [Prevotella sp.]MCM1074895.1 endonuclease [Ruminococcus sp.]
MKSKILLIAAALCPMLSYAEIPDGYYADCEGKTKAALKNQLYTIVKNHTKISYGNGNNQTWGVFFDSDVHPDGYWWDIYTTNQVKVGSGAPDNNTMNKEHTFPKSWWGGNKNNAYCDVMHLMPTNSVANSTRSNWPYGEVASEQSISNKCPNPRFKHGSPVSGQGGGSNHVFEPDDEFKGDLARTYFYMVTCYQDLTWKENGLYTAAQGTYPTLQPWAIDMLLRWHRNDPVSQKELDRNEAVYKHQHNRNPFIDHPEMAEYIWGDKMGEAWSSSGGGGTIVDPDPDPDPNPEPVTDAKLTAPINGDWYTFSTTNPGESVLMEIPVVGSGFTHNLTARIGGDAAALYSFKVGTLSLQAISINAADVASTEGYTLKVEYKPLTATPQDANDEATITITCQDLAAPVTANLQGQCVASVELTAITTLPVEDEEESGYTLHWLPSALEPDFYTVTRKIYDEDDTPEILTYEVDGEKTSLRIDDRDPSKKEVLSVTATLGDTESPAGNEVIVNASAALSSINIEQGTPRYFDASGIELPSRPDAPGVYMVRIGNTTTKTVIIK